MAKHKVRVIQVFRVEREIVVEVDAPDLEQAVTIQAIADSPDDDLDWKYDWKLQNEEVLPA